MKCISSLPCLANRMMPYELYYQHLHARHQHINDHLCSFAITIVGNSRPNFPFSALEPTTAFEEELMNSMQDGTKNKLFYSIKATSFSEMDGGYLWVTNKELILVAQNKFIDRVFHSTCMRKIRIR